MKRFHIHVGVSDLKKSIQFYSTLFGAAPTKEKEDYAKWMLENPKLNFAISTRSGEIGVNHLGIQVEEPSELSEITERLRSAEVTLSDEGESTCCYSKSDKAWVTDPSGLPWEAYRNMADVEIYGEKSEEESDCCVSESEGSSSSCCG